MGKIWQQGNKADLCLGENLVYVPVIAVEQTTPKMGTDDIILWAI